MRHYRSGLIILPLVLASCSGYVPSRYYLIDSDPRVRKAPKPYPLSIEVNGVRAPSRYQNQMVYRTDDYEIGFYEYSKWAELPAEMVRDALVMALRRSELFDTIDPVSVSAMPDLSILAELRAFDQVISGKKLEAHCAINLEVLDAGKDATIWSHAASASVPQKGKEQFVAAMSEAVNRTIAELIGALEQSREIKKFAAAKERARRRATPTPGARQASPDKATDR